MFYLYCIPQGILDFLPKLDSPPSFPFSINGTFLANCSSFGTQLNSTPSLETPSHIESKVDAFFHVSLVIMS